MNSIVFFALMTCTLFLSYVLCRANLRQNHRLNVRILQALNALAFSALLAGILLGFTLNKVSYVVGGVALGFMIHGICWVFTAWFSNGNNPDTRRVAIVLLLLGCVLFIINLTLLGNIPSDIPLVDQFRYPRD
jgi:hypothetical protein